MSFERQRTPSIAQYCHLEGAGAELLRANTLIGYQVRNYKDEVLAHIKDLILNPASGEVCYAVLCAGGFLGMGETCHVVPWRALSLDARSNRFTLDIGRARFKVAPSFAVAGLPDTAGSTWAKRVDDYYGSQAVDAPSPATERVIARG